MTTPGFDQPTIDDETRPWWDALREERLLVRRCAPCGRAHLYPRSFCPTCWSEDVSWEQAGGSATLYTYSIVRSNGLPPFRDRVPYVAAMVDLAEGPRLTSTVEGDFGDLRIGMPLRLGFRHGEDYSLPVFHAA